MVTTPLQTAAQAVIDRWDSPSWKDQPHTGEYILALRKALDAELQQAVETVAWYEHNPDLDAWFLAYSKNPNQYIKSRPLYLHPPQRQAPPVPDLLKEFKNVMSWIDNWSPEFSCDPDWPDDRDKAHAAIAAQGENP